MLPMILSALTFTNTNYLELENEFKHQQLKPIPLLELPETQQQQQLILPEKAITLVKFFEGLKLSRYYCPSGKLTIGYGHTGIGTRNFSISKLQAEELLKQDLLVFQKVVRDNVKVPLTSYQFGALVSFSFNVGEGAFKRSTLLKLLNNKKYSSVPSELLKWTRDNRKRILPGLIKRRKAESQLFMASEEKLLY